MLIGFIGAPCSGKTTTAAKLFAKLKESGIPSEFIPEQARFYIAENKFNGVKGLGDYDQRQILRKQNYCEKVVVASTGPEAMVVTDSSVLNTALYVDKALEYADFNVLWEEGLPRYDLLFVCAPVERPLVSDPNRVHSEEEALKLNDKIPNLLKYFQLDLEPAERTNGFKAKVVFLAGDPNVRLHTAFRTVMELNE